MELTLMMGGRSHDNTEQKNKKLWHKVDEEGKWWWREWWRREVVTKGSGDEGKWWRREVVTKGSGDDGKWWRREVVTMGSGDEGKWWRSEVVTMGSGEEGKRWRRQVVSWGGSRSTKPCVFPCKVASAGDERYLVCAAGAVWIVSSSIGSSYCSCVRSSMRFLNLWLQIALEWLLHCRHLMLPRA